MGPHAAVASDQVGKDRSAEQRGISPFGVLLIGNFLSKTRPGSCTVCELLAARLSSVGWPVLTTSDKSRRLHRFADMLMTVWRRRLEYAAAQVDVYSGPSFIWAEGVCWLLSRLGKPFILTLHGGNLPSFARRWPGRVRRLLNSASAVTTPSRYLQDALGPYRDDLLLLPNAIDLAAYPFRLRSNPQPKLVWLRALHGSYNPCMAVRTVAHLLEAENPLTSDLRPLASGLHLSMFGPDKGDGAFEKLKAEIGNLKLEDRVSLPGAVPKREVSVALSVGDIFLNTTNVDNTPVSVIEAMACGLCVVSTNVGGLPYLLEDEQDSLLVQPNDAKAMAAGVQRVISELGLAARLSRNARAKVEQFDWSVVLPKWQRLLHKVAGRDLLVAHLC